MATQKQADALIRHQTYISRYGAGSANRLLKVLVFGRIEQILKKDWPVNRKIRELKKEIERQKKKSNKLLVKELKALYDVEYGFLAFIVNESLMKPRKKLDTIIDEALKKPLIGQQGAGKGVTPLEAYNAAWQSLESSTAGYVRTEAIVSGALAEETLIRPSVIEAAFARYLTSSVRTAAFATASQIKEELYQANKDIVRGVMFSAVLDGRTSDFCKSVDSQIVPIDSGERPPFHINCRTLAIPVMEGETNEEAQQVLQYRAQVRAGKNYEIKASTREKKSTRKNISSGKVEVKTGSKFPSGSNYQTFLKVQVNSAGGRNFIKDTMGKKKGEAFIQAVREGKSYDGLMADLLKIDARTLTAEQLLQRVKR